MKRIFLFLCLAVAITAAPALGGVILGGTDHGNLGTALGTLGVAYTDIGGTMIDPTSYGAGDVLIMGMDGGGEPFYDYNAFLNAGGHVILTGGTNYDPYRAWAAGYFNTTDTGSGWHMDGAWHRFGSHVATQYMPADYTFGALNVSYHMLSFLATPNTVLLGTNDEPNYILAFRTFSNGGTFEYLALDPAPSIYGTAADMSNFTVPFLRGALEAAEGESAVPEPATCGLIGLGITLIAAFRKRR